MLRMGIDLGGTKIEGMVIDAESMPLARIRVPTPRGDYQATLKALVGVVEILEKKVAGISKGTPEICSIGMGAPGAISPATGLVKNANSVWLNGRPLKEDLEERFGRKIRMANDADCFTLFEAVDGAAVGASPVFGVILGTGVGGGIVFDGRIVTGRGSDTDTMVASARAYISALNKLLAREGRRKPETMLAS